MTERSHVSEVTQLGPEATGSPGTTVAATRRLQAVDIKLDPDGEFDSFRPAGQVFDTLAYPIKEWTAGEIDGRPCYNELPYLLASVLCNVAPTQILDGATPTGAYRWTFTPNVNGGDTPRTYTIERGGSYRAGRAGYMLVTDLELGISRDEALTLGGQAIGQRYTDGVALTTGGGVLQSAAVPIKPGDVDLYLDTTSAGLGTTKLARAEGLELSLGGRWGTTWPLDSSKQSFAAHLDRPVDATADLTVQADAQGMGLLPVMRAGDIRYLRLKATGPTIYTGGVTVAHSFTVDMAVRVNELGGFDDADDEEVFGWGLDLVNDPGWSGGRALTAEVVTTLSAL